MERKGINKVATSLAASPLSEGKVVKGAITGRRSGDGAPRRRDGGGMAEVTGGASRLRQGAAGWLVPKKVDNYDGDDCCAI